MLERLGHLSGEAHLSNYKRPTEVFIWLCKVLHVLLVRRRTLRRLSSVRESSRTKRRRKRRVRFRTSVSFMVKKGH